MRARLAALEPRHAHATAEEIATRALAQPAVSGKSIVLCCLSFGHELDTRRLIGRMLGVGYQVCVPRCVEATRELTAHPYPCPLERLSFGLEQPTADCPTFDLDRVEAAVLVGLAFDRRGFRLGYGGGYFDRFLASHPIPTLGLAYDSQIVARLPSTDHDIPMTAVVTETRILSPVAQSGPAPNAAS